MMENNEEKVVVETETQPEATQTVESQVESETTAPETAPIADDVAV